MRLISLGLVIYSSRSFELAPNFTNTYHRKVTLNICSGIEWWLSSHPYTTSSSTSSTPPPSPFHPSFKGSCASFADIQFDVVLSDLVAIASPPPNTIDQQVLQQMLIRAKFCHMVFSSWEDCGDASPASTDPSSIARTIIHRMRIQILSHLQIDSTTSPPLDNTSLEMSNFAKNEISQILTVGSPLPLHDNDPSASPIFGHKFSNTIIASCTTPDFVSVSPLENSNSPQAITIIVNEQPILVHSRSTCGGFTGSGNDSPVTTLTSVKTTDFEHSIGACPMGSGFESIPAFDEWGGVRVIRGNNNNNNSNNNNDSNDSNDSNNNNYFDSLAESCSPIYLKLLLSHPSANIQFQHLRTSTPSSTAWFDAGANFVSKGGFNDHALACYFRGFGELLENGNSVDLIDIKDKLLSLGLLFGSVQDVEGMVGANFGVLALEDNDNDNPPNVEIFVSALVRVICYVPVITPFEPYDYWYGPLNKTETWRSDYIQDMASLRISVIEKITRKFRAKVDPTKLLASTLFHLSHMGGGDDGDKAVMVEFRRLIGSVMRLGEEEPPPPKSQNNRIQTSLPLQ